MNTEAFTLDSKPHAPLTVVSREGARGLYLLLDPDTPNWVIVDDIGKSIVELCDGKTTVREIIETLCEKYDEPYEESVNGVLAFANELKEKQFLRKEEFQPCKKVEKGNMTFEELWISVTNKCNLQCMHCRVAAGTPLENELTTEEICRIIEEAAELGVKQLVITGGEPLLRKDILDILAYAREHINNVLLLTNGTLLTEGIVEKLKELKIRIQVSLDGAREETHDFIRGKGSYKKAIEGLQKLVKIGIKPYISMTIMKKNLNEISEMVALAKQLGVKNMHFPALLIRGRAKENEPVVKLEDEDNIAALKKIIEIPKTEDMNVSMEKNFRSKIEAMRKADLCGVGCTVVSIAADGNVYPCARFHEAEFCCGNIREKPLEYIQKESEVLNRFKSFSVLNIPECNTCDLKFICGGGCLVDTYHVYNRLDAPTPLCNVQKEVYWHLLFEKMKEVQKTF